MLRLSIQPPSGKVYSLPVADLPLKIGRSSRSDVRLEDPFASRLHAELYDDGGVCRVSDLGSGNGTYLNGRKVGSHAEVQPGDRLQIGNTLIEIQTVGGRAASAAAEPAPDEAATGELIARPRSTRRRDAGAARLPPLSALMEAVRGSTGDSGEVRALAARNDLLSVISKVGSTLLNPADLDEVLSQRGERAAELLERVDREISSCLATALQADGLTVVVMRRTP